VGAVIWASLVALAVSSHAVPERVPAGRTRGREPALDVSG
jgi:hypothetical protein